MAWNRASSAGVQAAMKRTIPGFLVMLLLLSACAASGVAPTSTGSGDPSPEASEPPPSESEGGGETGAIEHPTGAEAVLVVGSEGGFVPIQFTATMLPAFVLLGDGRVIMQGPQSLEFPGPAYPPLIERTLTEEGIQQVLEGVGETNLFTSDLELNAGQGICADCASTVFTVNAAGQEVTVSVYGLGSLLPDMEPPPGVSSAEIEAHRLLGGLNDGLMTLDTWLPAEAWEAEGWQPYEPDAFRLYVRDVTGEPIEGGEMPEQVRDWPTDDDPAAFGAEEAFFGDGTRCGVVDGELGASWLEELAAANQMTLWTDDGDRRFSVLARPVLPHEDAACPEFGGGA